jgi:ABC-type antimicrobial peptide transport system permease subunit
VRDNLMQSPVDGVEVREINCLSQCENPVAVAFVAPEKFSFIVSSLDPNHNAADIINFAQKHFETRDGRVKSADRPESIIKNLKGRFINHLDLIDKRKIAIIGNRSKDVLFGKEEDPINKYIKINGIYFLVVGHFKSEKTNDGGELAESIFIPFTTFQNAFNSSNKVGWFSITSKEKIPASIAQEKVLEFLKQRHQIAPDDKQAIGSWNPQEELLKMQGLFLGIRILIWIVGIGTLLAGIIGVSNIMLIVIKERTREIGIKRAIGANPNKIIIQMEGNQP